MKKSLLSILKYGFLIILLLVSYRVLFVTPQYWSGTYYPRGNSHGPAIFSPRFDWKEECVAWAVNERALHPEDASVPLGDLWECNKNCVLSGESITLINSKPVKMPDNSVKDFKQDYLKDNSILYKCDEGGFDGADWLRGDY